MLTDQTTVWTSDTYPCGCLDLAASIRLSAARNAAHTRCADAGMSSRRTPAGRSASSTAFIAAGNDPVVPASPAPFTPSGLFGDGTGRSIKVMLGSISACGIA